MEARVTAARVSSTGGDRRRGTRAGWACGVALLALLGASGAHAGGEKIGTVISALSQVTSSGITGRKLAKGDAIYAGDVIDTGDGGKVEVAMEDGSKLAIGPESSVEMGGRGLDPTLTSSSVPPATGEASGGTPSAGGSGSGTAPAGTTVATLPSGTGASGTGAASGSGGTTTASTSGGVTTGAGSSSAGSGSTAPVTGTTGMTGGASGTGTSGGGTSSGGTASSGGSASGTGTSDTPSSTSGSGDVTSTRPVTPVTATSSEALGAPKLRKGSMRIVTPKKEKRIRHMRTPLGELLLAAAVADVFVDASGETAVLLHEGALDVCGYGTCRHHATIGHFVHIGRSGLLSEPAKWSDAMIPGFTLKRAFPFLGARLLIDPIRRGKHVALLVPGDVGKILKGGKILKKLGGKTLGKALGKGLGKGFGKARKGFRIPKLGGKLPF